MDHQLRQTGFYEIESKISNIIWDNNSKGRIYISDLDGYVHTLRYHKVGGRISKLGDPKKVMGAIYSMDEYRRGGNSSKLVLGGENGEIVMYDVETQESQEIGKDHKPRPVAKIISIQDRDELFTFSWGTTKQDGDESSTPPSMQIWDINKKKLLYNHPLKENFVTAEYVAPYIVVVFGNNTIAFIDTRNYGKGSSLREKPIGHSGTMIKSLAFNKSLDYMALGDIAGNIKILERKTDLSEFNRLNTTDKLIGKDYSIIFECNAHSAQFYLKDNSTKKPIKLLFSVNALDFNPKNPQLVYSAGGDASVYSIHTQNERGLQKDKYSDERGENTFNGPFTHLKFNPEGNALITAEIRDNHLEVFKNPDTPYEARSIVRAFDTESNT